MVVIYMRDILTNIHIYLEGAGAGFDSNEVGDVSLKNVSEYLSR